MGKLGEILSHPEEVLPLARMYLASRQACRLPDDPKLAFCYDVLNTVSRSFAVVIQQLPNPLRDAICVFYLVLRGLDTVEDDMAIPLAPKVRDLRAFHEYIYQRGFTMRCGYGPYVRLMAEFDTVVDVFLGLDEGYQAVIADITRRMGAGMADFAARVDVDTTAEYDLYCHYVAGLVGVGLSDMFASSGLEARGLAKLSGLSNDMGLFLQKANIIRDYLEDITEEPAPRMFWPADVWSRYGARLADFQDPANRAAAVRCLNHLVTNALRHLPRCLDYLGRLKHPDVFRFCAIPQVMAAGTLALCYNNGAVFERAVKMRRGETARVFDEVTGMPGARRWLLKYLGELRRKADAEVDPNDPTVGAMRAAVDECRALIERAQAEEGDAAAQSRGGGEHALALAGLLAAGAFFYRAWGLGDGSAAALIGSGPLLPGGGAGTVGVERYLALVLLLACAARVVAARA